MSHLTIHAGGLSFGASWEAAAPQTVAAIQRMLPIQAQLIHVRWSGEAAWIPFGALDPGVGYENHTSYPAPGQILLYAGPLSECELLIPYGACRFSSKVGQLAGNHFATIDRGNELLVELGRRVLWDGAQPIELSPSP